MTRLLLMAVGSVAGAVVVRRLGAAARRATPESVADASTRFASTVAGTASRGVGAQVSRLGETVGEFVATVRAGAAEREQLLRSALAVDVDAAGVDPETARHLLEHPTRAVEDRRAG